MGTVKTALRERDTVEVLVVDDDSNIRDMLTWALANEGCRVVAAKHGALALVQLRIRLPAVMLLDLDMPVMDGWHVLDRVQAAHIAVPVIVMTAGTDARTEAAHRGAADYLAKPFDLARLFKAVKRCVPMAA
jgi:DNA-binding NtrC family response regulator